MEEVSSKTKRKQRKGRINGIVITKALTSDAPSEIDGEEGLLLLCLASINHHLLCTHLRFDLMHIQFYLYHTYCIV